MPARLTTRLFLLLTGHLPGSLAAIACTTLLAIAATATAQEAAENIPDVSPPDQETLESEFAQMLSGAVLEGFFTDDARDERAPRSDKYTLAEVRKLQDNLWLFRARIQYGNNDVTLPITLPVEWAGDSPVIIVENVGIPGLGEYSARVMFHGDRYAGTWQGTTHGGHMYGTIEPAEAVETKDADNDSTDDADESR